MRSRHLSILVLLVALSLRSALLNPQDRGPQSTDTTVTDANKAAEDEDKWLKNLLAPFAFITGLALPGALLQIPNTISEYRKEMRAYAEYQNLGPDTRAFERELKIQGDLIRENLNKFQEHALRLQALKDRIDQKRGTKTAEAWLVTPEAKAFFHSPEGREWIVQFSREWLETTRPYRELTQQLNHLQRARNEIRKKAEAHGIKIGPYITEFAPLRFGEMPPLHVGPEPSPLRTDVAMRLNIFRDNNCEVLRELAKPDESRHQFQQNPRLKALGKNYWQWIYVGAGAITGTASHLINSELEANKERRKKQLLEKQPEIQKKKIEDDSLKADQLKLFARIADPDDGQKKLAGFYHVLRSALVKNQAAILDQIEDKVGDNPKREENLAKLRQLFELDPKTKQVRADLRVAFQDKLDKVFEESRITTMPAIHKYLHETRDHVKRKQFPLIGDEERYRKILTQTYREFFRSNAFIQLAPGTSTAFISGPLLQRIVDDAFEMTRDLHIEAPETPTTRPLALPAAGQKGNELSGNPITRDEPIARIGD